MPTKVEEIIMFSADPGTKNFAITVLKGRCIREITYRNIVVEGRKHKRKLVQKRLEIEILGTGMIAHDKLLYNVVEAQAELMAFEENLKQILSPYDIGIVYMERFQSRGNGGSTIEAINMGLGRITSMFNHLGPKYPRFITAATWKNRANKKFDLKHEYKNQGLTSKAKTYEGPTEHQLDSTLIGVYGLHQHFGIDDFEIFDTDGYFDQFMEEFKAYPKL